MPGPWSCDDDLAAADADLDRRAGGLYLTALSSRFETARSSSTGSACTMRRRERGHERHLRRARLRALDDAPRRGRRAARPRSAACAPRRARARRGRRRAASARRARPTPRRARAAPRPSGSFPSRSRSTFVRAAVSGVRSSCEASATRRRCAPTDFSSAASIALNRVARRPSSSSPTTSTRSVRLPVAATFSAAAVRRRTGRSAAVATNAASAGGERRCRCRRSG